jgi:hypothetical protein
LLQSVCVRGNSIRDIPFELSGLKKLKDLELDDNPLDDPKIKKMCKNGAAGLIKEIVPYLKKRGKTAASQPLPRATSADAAAAAVSAPKPAAAPAPAPAAPAPVVAPSQGDDDDDDDGGKKLSKKDRAKLERRALEEKQRAAAVALAQKAAQEPVSRATADDDAEDADGSGSDDEDEAEMVRRRKGAGSFLYALDPAERERLEREDAERLRQAAEEKAAREAAARAKEEEEEADEAEKRMKALALKEAKSEGIAWVFTAGVIQKVPASTLPVGSAARLKAAKSGGGSETFYELVCELPGIMVGRIIGKGGATIKEVTQRSGARISISDNAAPGFAHLQVAGSPQALESARMLINNALASKR